MQYKPTPTFGYMSIHPCKNAKDTHPQFMTRDHLTVPIWKLEIAAEYLLTRSWSTVKWTDGHSKNVNFIEAWGIPLDIDEGLSLDEAMRLIEPYAHVVATTRSHQKDKKGIIADRYRVYLPTATVIKTAAEFSATVSQWVSKLRGDTNGISPAQHYLPAVALHSIGDSGKRISIEIPPPKREFKAPQGGGRTCEIWAANFLLDPMKYGGRQKACFIAARRLAEGGRSREFSVQFIRARTDLPVCEVQHAVNSAFRRTFNES